MPPGEGCSWVFWVYKKGRGMNQLTVTNLASTSDTD